MKSSVVQIVVLVAMAGGTFMFSLFSLESEKPAYWLFGAVVCAWIGLILGGYLAFVAYGHGEKVKTLEAERKEWRRQLHKLAVQVQVSLSASTPADDRFPKDPLVIFRETQEAIIALSACHDQLRREKHTLFVEMRMALMVMAETAIALFTHRMPRPVTTMPVIDRARGVRLEIPGGYALYKVVEGDVAQVTEGRLQEWREELILAAIRRLGITGEGTEPEPLLDFGALGNVVKQHPRAFADVIEAEEKSGRLQDHPYREELLEVARRPNEEAECRLAFDEFLWPRLQEHARRFTEPNGIEGMLSLVKPEQLLAVIVAYQKRFLKWYHKQTDHAGLGLQLDNRGVFCSSGAKIFAEVELADIVIDLTDIKERSEALKVLEGLYAAAMQIHRLFPGITCRYTGAVPLTVTVESVEPMDRDYYASIWGDPNAPSDEEDEESVVAELAAELNPPLVDGAKP